MLRVIWKKAVRPKMKSALVRGEHGLGTAFFGGVPAISAILCVLLVLASPLSSDWFWLDRWWCHIDVSDMVFTARHLIVNLALSCGSFTGSLEM